MKELYSHTILRTSLPVLLCGVSLLPAAAQNANEKEIELNLDAVKMIQFDFSLPDDKIAKPLEAPLEKSWMKFRTDIGMPRSMIDSTRVKKIVGFIRAEPYTIWTKFGEDPVYDVLVEGRPKEWKIQWVLNPFRQTGYDSYSRDLPVPTGRFYDLATGGSGAGGAAVIEGDINGLLYDVLTKRGRMLAHNRKHANAWKTYSDYRPTKADSLKFPHYIRAVATAAPMKGRTDTADVRALSGIRLTEGLLISAPFGDARTLPVYRPAEAENDSTETLHAAQENTQETKKETAQKKDAGDNVSDWYREMERQKAQDSLYRQEFFRKDRIRNNQYDVEKQQRRLKELQD